MDEKKKTTMPLSFVMPKLVKIQPLINISPKFNFQSPLIKMVESLARIQEKYAQNEKAIATSLKSAFDNIAKIGDGIVRMAEEASKTYPKLLVAVGPLSQRGWFLSGYCGYTEFRGIARQCGDVSDQELDRLVRDLYVSSVNDHGASLLRDYPHRAFAIQPAIDAHNRGEYALSVPVFFAQAEGICFDQRQKYIFTNTKAKGGVDENIKSTATKKLAEIDAAKLDELTKSLSVITEIMWRHLAEPLPVGYGPKDRENNKYDGLNRNTVMHGLDLNYATEENSLKAFSMLSFIGSLMHGVKGKEG